VLSFPNSYDFFCFASDKSLEQFYEGIIKDWQIKPTLISSYKEIDKFLSKGRVPIIIDLIFREYCPECKQLMPPGRPPLKCHCGEEVRLGYIPLYELPRTPKGLIIAPPELPNKTMKLLRWKGWKVSRFKEDASVFDLFNFIEGIVNGTHKKKEDITREATDQVC
jgi:hypothetical protein